MAKKLIISIDKNGFVTAEVNGVKGEKCRDYLALLEDILEGKAVTEELTQEYYEQPVKLNEEQRIDTVSK
ncbi:MAG: DUF2997 domain-containing protein [Tannerellaceae bacterium]|jgi:hypothetical protein|nr:DUF2997 domain-containing protein [Tannerellaceae bacterium]